MTHPPTPDTRASSTLTRRALLAKFRHDLRTPLNALIGYSELMGEERQEHGASEHAAELQCIRADGLGLLDGVNALLAHERIESGSLDGDLTDFAEQVRRDVLAPATALGARLDRLAGRWDDPLGPADLRKVRSAAESFVAQVQAVLAYAHTPAAAPAQEPRLALVQDAVESIRALERGDDGARSAPGGTILVVDDGEANRDVLAQNLVRQGHTVVTAANGRDALDLLAARKCDLILLDVLMPEMNGYEVLQALKADKAWREIPVIMISALDELESIVRCIQMGAEDYLPKPFNATLLQARIDASLEKKRFRDWQRELFHKFTTKEVADELFAHGFALGGRLVDATAMFCDIRSFTTIAESLPPDETIALLNGYFAHMMSAIESEGGIVNQIAGDGLMAIFGAPLPHADHRARAVRAALQMMERVAEFNREQAAANRVQIRIGIGVASGPMVAGYTGTEMRATYTCIGDTVNLAARLETHTKVAGQPILIDARTRAGLPDDIRVEAQGQVQLKGKTQAVQVYAVPPGQRKSLRPASG